MVCCILFSSFYHIYCAQGLWPMLHIVYYQGNNNNNQLKIVPQRKLHLPRATRRLGNYPKARRIQQDVVGVGQHVGIAGHREIHVVEQVERLPPELHRVVFRPRHREVLRHRYIQVRKARPMHRIPSPGASPEGEAKRSQSSRLVREELNRTRCRIGVDVLPDRLLVPIENRWRVLREVDRERPGVRREREACAIAQDPGSRPPTYDLVHPVARAAQEPLPAAERQVVHVVGADDVSSVEKRIRPARPQVRKVANQTLSAGCELVSIVDNVRLVVDRVRVRIIEVD